MDVLKLKESLNKLEIILINILNFNIFIFSPYICLAVIIINHLIIGYPEKSHVFQLISENSHSF